MRRPLHIAIGAGNLTGGMIAARHDPSLTDLIVASRTSAKPVAVHAAQTNTFRIVEDGGAPKEIGFSEFIWYDTVAGHERFIEAIAERDQVVITTAVGAGQPTVMAFLEGLPKDLWADRSVTIVPCENAVNPGWVRLGTRLGVSVLPDVVVDRICIRRDDAPETIHAEPYCEWKIEDESADSVASLIGAIAVPDISFARRRKLLLVNGLQLCLALLALSFTPDEVDDTQRLDEFLDTDLGAVALDALAFEYSLALAWDHRTVDPQEIRDHAEICKQRMRASTDRPLRIIIGGDGDLEKWKGSLLPKVHDRLVLPSEAYCQFSGLTLEETVMGEAWAVLVEFLKYLG